jgi:hypothetical protein
LSLYCPLLNGHDRKLHNKLLDGKMLCEYVCQSDVECSKCEEGRALIPPREFCYAAVR